MAVVGGSALKIVEFAVVPLLFFGVEQGIDNHVGAAQTAGFEFFVTVVASTNELFSLIHLPKICCAFWATDGCVAKVL